jgi:hypothetical protein
VPGRRIPEAGRQAEQRGLARTAGPDDRVHAARPELARQPDQRRDGRPGVGERDVAEHQRVARRAIRGALRAGTGLALQFGELKDALGGRQGLTEGRRRPSQLLDWAEQQEDVHQDADQLRRRQLTGIHQDHPGDQHHQERGREARRANSGERRLGPDDSQASRP